MTLPLLQSPKLSQAGFSHGFTTRLGGVSPPPYESLDFAVLRGPEQLRENQARLAAAVGFDAGVLHQAMQVHGATLLVAGGDPKATLALDADALVAEPGTAHAVAVRIADCVPVLIADPHSGRVAAAHAGWRGVEAGVVRVSVQHLAEAPGAGSPTGFIAAIGPSIGPCCFEVGRDVGDRIVNASTPAAIDRQAGEKVFVDLRAAVRAQLRSLGLADDAIDDVTPVIGSRGSAEGGTRDVPGRGPQGCTRCDRERFYSYRRDGDTSGRLIGVIVARG